MTIPRAATICYRAERWAWALFPPLAFLLWLAGDIIVVFANLPAAASVRYR